MLYVSWSISRLCQTSWLTRWLGITTQTSKKVCKMVFGPEPQIKQTTLFFHAHPNYITIRGSWICYVIRVVIHLRPLPNIVINKKNNKVIYKSSVLAKVSQPDCFKRTDTLWPEFSKLCPKIIKNALHLLNQQKSDLNAYPLEPKYTSFYHFQPKITFIGQLNHISII